MLKYISSFLYSEASPSGVDDKLNTSSPAPPSPPAPPAPPPTPSSSSPATPAIPALPAPPPPTPSSSLYELKLSYDIPRNIIEASKAKLKKVDSLHVQSVCNTSLKYHIIETKKRLKPTQINVHKKENRDIVSLCSLSNDVLLELLGSVSRII